MSTTAIDSPQQDSIEPPVDYRDLSFGAKFFVSAVFTILALSFIATTAVLINEFWEGHQWLRLGVYYSHLFIFFPTFGIIALYAFYLPAVVFCDLYWHHLRFGKLRFLTGSLIILFLSYLISGQILSGQLPTIWEIKPQILAQDTNIPPQCTIHLDKAPAIPCQRLSINNAVEHVRVISSQRVGLSKFIRNCDYDHFLPEPNQRAEVRHCFANGQRETAKGCCAAQKLLGDRLRSFKADSSDNLSLTGKVHAMLLPLKIFFLITLLFIGVMLVFWSWRETLDTIYHKHIYNIEKGLLSGVAAMLFWPITNHAFLQSATVLFGYDYHSGSFFARTAPLFSVIFGIWAALIVLFFLQHREQKQVELLLKFIGVIISAVAVVKYDLLIDGFVRFAGSGADKYAIIFMFVALSIVLLPLFGREKKSHQNETSQLNEQTSRKKVI